MKTTIIVVVSVAILAFVGCGSTEELDEQAGDADTSDVADATDAATGDVDPLSECLTRAGGEATPADLFGGCGYTSPLNVVIESVDELDVSEFYCGEMLEALDELLTANPDQHVALALTSRTQTCGISVDEGIGYQDETGFTATVAFEERSAGCEISCTLGGSAWAAFLVDPGTQVDFCTGVVGGCL